MKIKYLQILGTIFILFFVQIVRADTSAWPKTLTLKNHQVTLYQPQIQTYENNQLDFMMAVGVLNGQQTIYGTLTATCNAITDSQSGSVIFSDIVVSNIDFPAVQNPAQLTSVINQALMQKEVSMTRDQFQASLKLSHINQLKSQNSQLSSTAPKIYIAYDPTVLVLIDGEPQFRNIPNTTLMRVINTAFVIILDTHSGINYLQTGNSWMQATQVLGPWTQAQEIPDAIKNLQTSTASANNQQIFQGVPNIIISTVPSALIQLKGQPLFTPITGTSLLYASNTDSELFFQIKDQVYYVLLSGRWYKSKDLTASSEWANVPADKLPADFANIPAGSDKADVLASIAHTQAALNAAIQNQLPQTAKIARDMTADNVTYDGEPQFKSITGTNLQYAINTGATVIAASNKYYLCDKGIWFESLSPTGPWKVSASIPDEIYLIPPTAPVYAVTNTYIYNATPDYIYVGYTDGYLNSYLDNGVIVYGTGYPYTPWIGSLYFGYPITFGFNFYYRNGYWGAYVPYHAAVWYGGGLKVGVAGWHTGWFGPATVAGAFGHYNHVNVHNTNIYNNWNNKGVVSTWNKNKNTVNNFKDEHATTLNNIKQNKGQNINTLEKKNVIPDKVKNMPDHDYTMPKRKNNLYKTPMDYHPNYPSNKSLSSHRSFENMQHESMPHNMGRGFNRRR